jgi:predicted nucleic acid-binding protein
VEALRAALDGAEVVVTTGLVLLELLQGFSGPRVRNAVLERFAFLPLIQPDREDHIAAAELRNICRRSGVQLGTIDALLIQLCGRYKLTMLSKDKDFEDARSVVPFKLWDAS